MIRILPNLPLSRVVGLCCLTGAVLMTAACSDSTSKYSPTTDIPETVDLSPSSSSSSSSGSSSGGPVTIEVDMDTGWRANPAELTWDYVAGGVYYEPTAVAHQLMFDLVTPRNLEGGTFAFDFEVDDAYVASGANLQFLVQEKAGYTGEYGCVVENADLETGPNEYTCELTGADDMDWNITHADGVQFGVQPPDPGAVPAGSVTITGVTITLAGESPPPPPAVNLLSDGGFEGEVPESGWNNWGGGSPRLSTDDFLEGEQSLLITSREVAADGAQLILTTRVTPGTTYDVKAMVKHTNTVPDVLKINAKVQCNGEDAAYPAVAEHAEAPVDTWTALEGQLTVPDCTLQEVLIYFENTTAEIDIFVDEMLVIAAEPVVNLVTDGGFEGEEITGWFGWADGVPSLSTDEKVSGAQSMLITDRAADAAGAGYAVTGGVAADTTYRVTAMAKHMGTGPDLLKINAKISCDGGDTYPAVAQVADAAADTWTKLEGDLVIPECTTVGEALIYFEGTAAGVDVYVDNVMIEMAPEPEPSANLIPDGGFEGETLTGWSTWAGSTLDVTSDQAYAGSQSMAITDRATSSANAAYNVTNLVSAGMTYDVNAWVLHTGAANDEVQLQTKVACTGEDDAYVPVETNAAVPPNEWTQLSGELVIPDGCVLTEALIYFENTSENVDVYVDEVWVTEPVAE